MSASLLNQFWIEFIDLYKSLPELWRKDTDEYTNKSLRAKAYQLLVEKYKEVDRDANIFTVKKKINNLRTCFRREVNKIRKSEQTALSQDDVYTPTLWYFPNLDFLIDEEDERLVEVEEVDVDEEYTTPQTKRKKVALPIISQISHVPEESYSTTNNTNNSNKYDKVRTLGASWEAQYRDLDYTTPQPKRKKVSLPIMSQTSHVPEESYSTTNNTTNSNKYDKVRTLGASWEVQYRDLDVRQKLYANRMINEVLYQGALGKLHENSYKILEMAVEDPNRVNHYSPASVAESQYILTESNEDLEMKHVTTEKRERRSKHSK